MVNGEWQVDMGVGCSGSRSYRNPSMRRQYDPTSLKQRPCDHVQNMRRSFTILVENAQRVQRALITAATPPSPSPIVKVIVFDPKANRKHGRFKKLVHDQIAYLVLHGMNEQDVIGRSNLFNVMIVPLP